MSMNCAVISGDIISSTSLSDGGRIVLQDRLMVVIAELKLRFNIYGRIVKGDYLECVVPDPSDALLVTLILKSFVKSLPASLLTDNKHTDRFHLFATHGIRLAIGYGQLSSFDAEKGIIDGEAIYLSGRTINEESTYNKGRVVVKNTLFFASANASLNNEFDALFALIDVLMSKATARQCEVLYWKLWGCDEEEIAAKLNITQSVVNRHSSAVGWNAIDRAVKRFAYVFKSI